MPKFEIPSELSSKLRYAGPKTTQSDEQITNTLSQFQPVVSEKNIWAFWHAGIHSMPSWNLRNVISWVRMHDAEWTVRVLDSVPDSPNYFLNYVPASFLPKALVDGKVHAEANFTAMVADAPKD